MKIFEAAKTNPNNTAVICEEKSYTYAQLIADSDNLANFLLAEKTDLKEARVSFMVSPGYDYVKTQWAIWKAGAVAVPLCISYPLPSLDYVINDTGSETLIIEKKYELIFSSWENKNKIKIIILEDINPMSSKTLPKISPERNAMILYTSGTTSLPKGVVSTHEIINAQVESLIHAWQWTAHDHILCVLPLHHIHGTINVISCALYAGAKLEFLSSYSDKGVFDAFLKSQINLFMAVPTIYFKLINYYEQLNEQDQKAMSRCMSKFRLMVSGSAALPVTVLEKWLKISNHTLLERYGMTEIGMGISNPYAAERKPGHIGMPLPAVNVRLMDDAHKIITNNEPGEIQIKGPNVFKEYWNKPEATAKAFTEDGWFKTGDIAVLENNYYRILGRDSVDIIKSGGYKISALEIEEVLLSNPDITECSVIGIPNEEWGELVTAVLVGKNIDFDNLNKWLRTKMPAYKVPRKYKLVNDLPRNAMGKITKNDLKKLFES